MPRRSKIIPFGYSFKRVGKPYIRKGKFSNELSVRTDDPVVPGLSSSRGFRSSGIMRNLRRIK